ncbi:MAG TPA: hypothetical protein VFA94_09655, partial [Acidimicrobiales bacterium]|nr:hypothetical protein [Acidimicrobiales bacterium]
MAADTTALGAAFAVAAVLSVQLETPRARGLLPGLCLPVCLAVFHRYGLHQARRVASLRHETTRVLHALAVCVALVPAVATLAGVPSPRPWLALVGASAVVLVLIERA